MYIQKIPSIGLFSLSSAPDAEHQEIMRRLRAYGITPTGDKNTDRNKLREAELKKAHEENSVTNKFLTVSTEEQEKIQKKKIEKYKELNSDNEFKNLEGLKAQGE